MPEHQHVGQSGIGIYVAFVPWVLFGLVTQHSTLSAATIVALAAAVIIAVPSILRRRPKLLELFAILIFAALTIAALTADASTADTLARYARAISAGGLALTAFASLLFVPFTEQYARESVPRQFWGTAGFRSINRRLSAMWGCVFLLMIPSHIVAGLLDTHRANVIFNWAIPIGLVIIAVKRTGVLSSRGGAQLSAVRPTPTT
jgi:hypothetical protein